MSSDLTIKTTSSSTLCYSCKVTVALAGITLVVLGILMLAKVKVLPERFFKENIKLEKAVQWSTFALGMILVTIGMGMLCNTHEEKKASASNSSDKSDKKDTNYSKRSKNVILESSARQEPDKKTLKNLIKAEKIEEAIVFFDELFLEAQRECHSNIWAGTYYFDQWKQCRIQMLKALIKDDKYNPHVIEILSSYIGAKNCSVYFDLFIDHFCEKYSSARLKNLISEIKHEILHEYLLFAWAKKCFLENQSKEALLLFNTIEPKPHYALNKKSPERDNYFLRTFIILLHREETLPQEKYKEIILLIRNHFDYDQQNILVERVQELGAHANDRSLASLFLCTLARIDDQEFRNESLQILATLPMPCAKHLCKEIEFISDLSIQKEALSLLAQFYTTHNKIDEAELVSRQLLSLA